MRLQLFVLLLISCVVAACGGGDDGSSAAVDAAGAADTVGGDAAASPDAVAEPQFVRPDYGELAWCEGETTLRYDPVAGEALEAYPDDFYSSDDDTTATGLRLAFGADRAPWIAKQPDTIQPIYLELASLDGFGTTAGIFLRFSAAFPEPPTGAEASLAQDTIQLLDLGDKDVRRVPFEAKRTDSNKTLIVKPLVPLRPATRHALVVTKALEDTEGGCIAPSPAMRALLTGDTDEPLLARLSERYAEVLVRSDLRPDDLTAALVFTTQDVHSLSIRIAEDIGKRDYEWSSGPDCESGATVRRCYGTVVSVDYRKDGVIDGPEPGAAYHLPVRVWLPANGEGPWPVLMLGHGIGGNAEQFGQLAGQVGGDTALVAIDALFHGSHPVSSAGGGFGGVDALLEFFGATISPMSLKGRVGRDNVRQSTFDKLQVLRLLATHPDVDGDGEPDLDMDRAGYMGFSLGGIMAPDLLALSPHMGLGVLSVAGAGIGVILTESRNFALVSQLLRGILRSQGAVDRARPVVQTLLEPGDGANWAPHILKDRFDVAGERAPHVLLSIAHGDETVANASSFILARAMGLPHVPPVVEPVDLLEVAKAAPLKGNVAGGTATAGLFQLDRMRFGESEAPVAADHSVGFSLEGFTQLFHFWSSFASTGTAELIDPYAALGTPALPASE